MLTCTKPKRSLRILARPTCDCAGRLALTVGGETDTYLFRSCPAARGGVEFTLAHDSGDEARVYTCVISPSGNNCGCRGFAYRGSCRHVEALSVLVQREAQAAAMPAAPRHPACLRCRDTRVVRSAGCVGVCRVCEGF